MMAMVMVMVMVKRHLIKKCEGLGVRCVKGTHLQHQHYMLSTNLQMLCGIHLHSTAMFSSNPELDGMPVWRHTYVLRNVSLSRDM